MRADFSQHIFDDTSLITLDLNKLRVLMEWPDCVDIARIFNLKKISLIRIHKLIFLSICLCRCVIILNFDKVFINSNLFNFVGRWVKADFCQYIFCYISLITLDYTHPSCNLIALLIPLVPLIPLIHLVPLITLLISLIPLALLIPLLSLILLIMPIVLSYFLYISCHLIPLIPLIPIC